MSNENVNVNNVDENDGDFGMTEELKYGTVHCPRLNVRKEPSINADIIDVVSKDDLLVIVDEKGEWFEVVAPSGEQGFCIKSFIAPVE